jgi:mevalonate pyrophosphate decarboxylase
MWQSAHTGNNVIKVSTSRRKVRSCSARRAVITASTLHATARVAAVARYASGSHGRSQYDSIKATRENGNTNDSTKPAVNPLNQAARTTNKM